MKRTGKLIFLAFSLLFVAVIIKRTDVRAQTVTPLPACLPSDIDKSGLVDKTDLFILRDNFFESPPDVLRADINGDGIADIADYSIMSTEFDISVYRECQ